MEINYTNNIWRGNSSIPAQKRKTTVCDSHSESL